MRPEESGREPVLPLPSPFSLSPPLVFEPTVCWRSSPYREGESNFHTTVRSFEDMLYVIDISIFPVYF